MQEILDFLWVLWYNILNENFRGGSERGRGSTIEFYAMWQRVCPEDVIAYAKANGLPVEPVS